MVAVPFASLRRRFAAEETDGADHEDIGDGRRW
jgi:hypothetical protein